MKTYFMRITVKTLSDNYILLIKLNSYTFTQNYENRKQETLVIGLD